MAWSNHFGLDIGTHSIKAVQIAPNGKDSFKLVSVGEMDTPEIADAPEKNVILAQNIKKFLKDIKISTKKVAISLPETQVYTRVVEMPFLQEPELSSAIKWQAEQYIPVPLTDVVLKHQVIANPTENAPGSKMQVLLVAAPNNLINNYITLLNHAGLEAVAMETEIIASARGVSTGQSLPPAILLQFGQGATILAIIVNSEIIFTQTIGTGGLALTRAIASDLSLSLPQAEQYKKTFGFDQTKLDGRIVKSLKPVTDVILAEVRRALAFYESHNLNQPLKQVILSGGASLTPGLVPIVAEALGLETLICHPFQSLAVTEQQKQTIGENGASYAVALGLALKSS